MKFVRNLSLLNNFRKIENKELLWLSTDEARNRSFIWGNENIENDYYLEKSLDNSKYLRTIGVTKFLEKCEGLPGYVHGGATCSILDELTGVCCYANRLNSMTGSLKVEYIQPVKLNTKLIVKSEITKIEENKIYVSAQMSDLTDLDNIYVKSENIYKLLKK